jgi:predicted N-formylglutamate amidohydrolase
VSSSFRQHELLAPDEPPAFERFELGHRLPVVVACDHASPRIPRSLEGLGVPEAAMQRHIAWDIGAANVARRLAEALEVTAVLAGYSRLVIDCNRHIEDPTSIVSESDGQVVPGNADLSPAARELRARACFWPYHEALEAALQALCNGPRVPALLAIHSFTPSMNGKARPWHCGVLWDQDPRIAVPLIAALREEEGLVVGDNEPYSGRHPADYTIDQHAEERGWPHVCVEIRQDLIAGDPGASGWADRLARMLKPILEDPGLYRQR